jgi:hypothetical protein
MMTGLEICAKLCIFKGGRAGNGTLDKTANCKVCKKWRVLLNYFHFDALLH